MDKHAVQVKLHPTTVAYTHTCKSNVWIINRAQHLYGAPGSSPGGNPGASRSLSVMAYMVQSLTLF